MTSVVELYEQLASAPDDKTRARLIAEVFERMEERYPEVKDPEVKDLATQTHLRETELRLQKEIEQLRSSVLRWLVGLLAGQTAVILAAIFAIARMQ
ncbi:hypothetical protein [Halorhodospira halophila]|uniref:hypothetical protein n=1 Tax=Halorhodospira halophila TaxID=1053 RepID=UPI0032098A2C|nr:hypothetical protein [Halorhodospira halophila]